MDTNCTVQPCPSTDPRETGARARLRPDTSVPAAVCNDRKPETSQWPPAGDGGADQLIQTRATAQRQVEPMTGSNYSVDESQNISLKKLSERRQTKRVHSA